MDLGFIQAGFDVVWANEIDATTCETYRHNVGGHIVQGDLRTVESKSIPDCDVVIGGPPCQGFSVAGKMDPYDPRSKLVWEFVRVVRDKRPLVFVMENVKALGRLEKWSEVRRSLVKATRAVGYDVEYCVLNSCEFGVPQQRERTIFIGTRKGTASDLFPKPTAERVSVREALSCLPRYGKAGNDGRCKAKVVPAKNPVMRRSPYAGMLFNGLGRPIDLERPAPTLPASMGGNKTPIIDQQSLETGEASWVVGYHRSLQMGCSPARSAPSRLRRLTVEESATLQGFPQTYTFCGPLGSKYKQIGNAVPPELARRIAVTLLCRL